MQSYVTLKLVQVTSKEPLFRVVSHFNIPAIKILASYHIYHGFKLILVEQLQQQFIVVAIAIIHGNYDKTLTLL